ncbi:MAG: GlsB/YeaQ/YmgE family stress response membrane protein [Acidimicrobiia bacterium]|nr:GlsB/YeaQ/YmgE family stress response membrane protein [Acidimicrobiia bacterium]
MGVMAWMVVGLVAGLLARGVTGTNRRADLHLGCLGTIVVGVAGGLLGGMMFNLAGNEGIGEFGLRSLFLAFVGASLLLLVVGALGESGRHERR